MDRETARQMIRTRIPCTNYLEKSKGGLYCCPNPTCGSGHGKNATGAVKYYPDTNTWYCHACGSGTDVIDLYRLQTGTDFNTALSLLAGEIGITIDQYNPAPGTERPHKAAGAPERRDRTQGVESAGHNAQAPQRGAEARTGEQADYTEYYKECLQRLEDPAAKEYLQRRGISTDTAAAYMIGYDPAADPARSGHPCPRIIIPTSTAHYIGRRIDGAKEFAKLNAKGSTPAIFNGRALYAEGVQEVFVTEGAFDALSILEAGYPAIALNSTANAEMLLKQLERRRTQATLILCLDNDESGQKAAGVLNSGLQRLNIAHITADINAGYKDPNEALTGNREAFIKAVERAQRQTAAKPDNTLYYINALMQGEIERFKGEKKTGFANLDRRADGLYAGLYVIAAISSLGKTSFALQLADQLAENGNDVVFFSLEQSRLELVSKSIARKTVIQKPNGEWDFKNAITSLAIRKGKTIKQALLAIEEYKRTTGDRVSIVEGNFNCNISFIRDYIRQYIDRTGTRPVVFIDYLQILQPAEELRRQSTKEIIDTTVTELRQISRELDLTIIVISSVNRANYLTPIDFESLKESGSIEFSCDVLWGLQLRCLNSPEFEKAGDKIKEKREIVRKAKAESPRKIELSCLKNRYGISNYSCYFDYYPANDLFTEEQDKDTDEPNPFDDEWAGVVKV